MMNNERGDSRAAFTLIELAVVIGIIGILLSLSTVGIQAVRAAARRGQCQENLRQIGLGIAQFESTHQIVPGNGGAAEKNFILSVDGKRIQPGVWKLPDETWVPWGVGSPQFTPKEQPGPWSYAILPYVEQTTQYESTLYELELSVLRCAERDREPPAVPTEDYYGRYEGGGHRFSKSDYSGNSNVFRNLPEVMKLKQITDGLSQTAFISEKAHSPVVQKATSWYFDEPPWLGGSHGTARNGKAIIPDGPKINLQNNWGSGHAQGVHVVFGDGHVDSATWTTDGEVWEAMLTIDARDSVQ